MIPTKCRPRLPAISLRRSVGVLVVLLIAGCSADPSDSPGGATEPTASTSKADVTTQVHRAGIRDARAFLGKVPKTKLSAYGFNAPEELEKVTVEAPIRVYTAPSAADEDGPRAFRPSDEWRLPLSVDGEWRALLTVSKQGKSYRAVSLGAAPLARDLQKKNRALPDNATRRFLLRVHKTRQDWLGYDAADRPETEFLGLMERRPPASPSLMPITASALLEKLRNTEELGR